MSNITDEAVECIKVIVDSNRCGTCDNISGKRVRHQCGHCYCDDCVAKVEHCLLCLTPPDAALPPPRTDDPAAQTASNAATLLNTFQEAYSLDVYKRSRISEQLKLEKEIFPGCIQAPVKYHNKRKSLLSLSNKYNTGPSFFPGESISPEKSVKMENSFNYVQNWLENNEKKPERSPRKPFADLDVNSPTGLKRRISERTSLFNEKSNKNSENVAIKKRRTGFKSSLALVESQKLLDTYIKPVKKEKKIQNIKQGVDKSEFSITKMISNSDKDESGIVMDDEPIVIDDSQSQLIDKDRLALMAVLEADERSPYVSQTSRLDGSEVARSDVEIPLKEDKNNQLSTSSKVPFYKRSYLTEPCFLCRTNTNNHAKQSVVNQAVCKPKDVSVTIENKSFITTIKITTCQSMPESERHSIPIQTDSCDMDTSYNIFMKPKSQAGDKINQEYQNSLASHGKEVPSQDLFTAEIEDHKSRLFPKVCNKVIISDSDSDDAANESSILQVTAEVHQSSEQLESDAVLSELELSDVQQRDKRCGRGVTPNSTNSSDKENFDPNKAKRVKLGKKEFKKKELLNKK